MTMGKKEEGEGKVGRWRVGVACPCTVDGVAGDAVVMKFPKGCKMEEVKSDQLVAVSMEGRVWLWVGRGCHC